MVVAPQRHRRRRTAVGCLRFHVLIAGAAERQHRQHVALRGAEGGRRRSGAGTRRLPTPLPSSLRPCCRSPHRNNRPAAPIAHEATPQCHARAPFRARRFYMPRDHFHVPRARLKVPARHLLLAFRTVNPTAPHFNLQMRKVVLAPSSLSRSHAALKNAPRRVKALSGHFRSPSAGQHGSSPSHAAAFLRRCG